MTTTTRIGGERRAEHLDERACWVHLFEEQVGRLAFDAATRTAIVPLNYFVRGDHLVFRTALDAGLLAEQRLPVSFEIDGWDPDGAWSVIASVRTSEWPSGQVSWWI